MIGKALCCNINWSAVSAICTFLATIVALIVPFIMSRITFKKERKDLLFDIDDTMFSLLYYCNGELDNSEETYYNIKYLCFRLHNFLKKGVKCYNLKKYANLLKNKKKILFANEFQYKNELNLFVDEYNSLKHRKGII